MPDERETTDSIPPPQKLYRAVKNNPPLREDFLSGKDSGRPRPFKEQEIPLWHGFSAFRTLEQARKKARAFPMQGTFIAAFPIPPGSVKVLSEVVISGNIEIQCARTLSTSGHFTVWGDPDRIAKGTEAVYRVNDEEGEERDV